MIEFDVETTGLQFYTDQHAFMFQFFDGEKGEHFFYDAHGRGREHHDEIQAWLDRGAVEGIRAWNTKFDLHFAEAAGFRLPPEDKWHDGMVAAHILDERRSMKLKDVSVKLFGPDADDWQKKVKSWLTKERAIRAKESREDGTELTEPTYADVPEELIVPYGMEDVHLTRRVSDQFEPVFDATPELRELYDFDQRAIGTLYDIERRGLPADDEGYHRLEVEVIENLERLEDQVLALAREGLGAGTEFNPKSSKQIIEALKARKADMSYMATEDGEIKSADKEQLEAVDDELAEAILNFRAEYKVLSTYVRPMIHRHWDAGMRMWWEPFVYDGLIHANYRQLGARTGRMSCAQPNMQNQPRDDLRLRYNIRAEPGYKLVTCDLSNIEMRLFAAYAGKGRLLEAVRRGEDLHTLTAKFIGITDRKRAGGSVESARQRGKTFNFSIIYGGGVRTVRRQQRVDQATARLMRRRYYDAYPEVENLQNRIEARLKDQGYITGLWGRRYRCDNPRKEAYKFVNYLVQGTAGDLFKESLIRLHGDGVPVVACIHDEVVAHVPEADAEEAKHLIIKRLVEHDDRLGGIVPLDADGDIVDRWSQAKNPDFVPRWAR